MTTVYMAASVASATATDTDPCDGIVGVTQASGLQHPVPRGPDRTIVARSLRPPDEEAGVALHAPAGAMRRGGGGAHTPAARAVIDAGVSAVLDVACPPAMAGAGMVDLPW